jgi:hypothetical protein
VTPKKTYVQAVEELNKKKAAYQSVFVGPNAEAVLTDLFERFNRTTLKKVDNVIDPYASIAASGCREVLLYIEQMMRNEDAVD